jgi:HSP20 family molecular chaperone IbpA
MDRLPDPQKEQSRTLSREISRPEQIRQAPHVHPAVDILDRPEEIVVRADMPGAAPDGIDVRFENGILILSGKVSPAGPESKDDLLREFVRADYYREFSLGEGIHQDKITAEYDSGVLTLHLPKAEAPRPRPIEVRRK